MSKLRETLQLAREFGVKRIKTSEFEIELGDLPTQVGAPGELTAQLRSLADDMPSDKELMLASSPFTTEDAEDEASE